MNSLSGTPQVNTGGSSDTADWKLVASYESYEEAQRAVDGLSDASFPVENIEIVGRDLRIVERVTGRLTTGGATLAGAGTGAWWGLFIGLLVGLFTTGPEWVGLVLGGIVIGAVWGAVFGFVAQWSTRGQRDFSSLRNLAAGHYDLMVAAANADSARALLRGEQPHDSHA
jgi:hypothetical protein